VEARERVEEKRRRRRRRRIRRIRKEDEDKAVKPIDRIHYQISTAARYYV